MNHFPHMMAFMSEFSKENIMYTFEDINLILIEMHDEQMVEPIDDPHVQTDFYDWADVVGVLDQIEPDVHFS